MVISYNKLWKLLIDRKMSNADLRQVAGIASNTMTKLNCDEEVPLETLGKNLRCAGSNIGDIVDLLPAVQIYLYDRRLIKMLDIEKNKFNGSRKYGTQARPTPV